YFTNFDDRFKARLSYIRSVRAREAYHEGQGISAKYTGIIQVQYHKDLMGLLEEGMILAVRNYRAFHQRQPRFTLLEITAVWPRHFGLSGLSDHTYYPLSHEIIEQSVVDWESSDTSTMMIQIAAIPINYDLILYQDKDPDFKRGFSYPIPAEEAFIANRDLINLMYNKRILDRLSNIPEKTTSNARRDPRLGVLKMFETAKEDIPLYMDFERLVRYHFGVFSFTGGGKSNLVSNIIRRLLYHTKDVKIIIFDIACEYPFLLLDVLSDTKIPSHVILEQQIGTAKELAATIVRPRGFEEDTRVESAFAPLLKREAFGCFEERTMSSQYTCGRVIRELLGYADETAGRAHYGDAVVMIEREIRNYMQQKNLSEEDSIDQDFVEFLDKVATDAMSDFRISDRAGLYSWATTRKKALKIDVIEEAPKGTPKLPLKNYSYADIRDLIEGPNRLLCLSIADPENLKNLVIYLTESLLYGRKRHFQIKPYILFVFDEAQEFIPQGARGLDQECNYQVEKLLRQGRKYGLGGCVATQRIAYLNTSALQQLHSFFVGTLPRPYDRSVVSSTFLVDQGILEKTLEFAPGEWLLSSYIATGMESVPIFMRADNAEDEVENCLRPLSK
ncbi:MAG: ATP-binding protein, partial [Promethearchaeota archaeon]